MLKHILTTFIRSALLSKFQLVTIVFGLTMGMVVSLLIYLYVTEESIYDKHHQAADRIFRLNSTLEMEGKVDPTAKAALNSGEALMEFYPEIESFTQVLNISKQTIEVGANLFASEKVVYADSNLFTFFTYSFIEGNPSDALLGPNKTVISRGAARQYFGSEEKAMGNTMQVNNVDFQVTGIYDETTSRTHIPYDVFLSLATLPRDFLQQRNREYMWLTTYNYIMLKPGINVVTFEPKLKTFNEKHLIPYMAKNQVNGSATFQLEPVTNIHLNNTLRFDFPGAINPDYLSIFSVVAVLTLFIALINYINLTTARVARRLKEIGIKKSVGASKATLLIQFLTETLLIVTISYVLALGLLYFSLPELNRLTDKTFTFGQVITPGFLYGSAAFILLFGLLAGAYPAAVLSSFKPIQALHSSATNMIATSFIQKIINPGFIRKVLVTLQFSISVFLIIGTIVIFRQFSYMRSRDMGFNQEQIIVIDVPNDTTVSNRLEAVKNKLRQIAAVKSVSSASSIPGTGHGALTMNVSQSGGSEIKVLNTYFTDEKFIEALDIELLQGRFFSKEFSTDPQQAFVINEAAAKFLGWDEPLDKKVISPFGQDGKVVGVVKDFNYKSLHSAIEPLILMNTPTSQGYLLIKISTSDLYKTVEQVSNYWKEFDGTHPYEYFFLDEKFQAQYVKEERLTKIFTYFSGLAILISCLGLVGLAIYTNELKTREIAIRKTLGASHLQVLQLLSKEFLGLILLANFLAWPAAYYIVADWLSDFAYQTKLDVFPFLYGMVIAFVIALLTISYFANKAARGNIVNALKYD